MKTFMVVLCCCFFISCNFKKAFEKADKIDADLKRTFQYEDIVTSISWGSSEENNKVTVIFYNFNLDSLSYPELTNLASRVGARICGRNPDLKSMAYIEVSFTKAPDVDKANGLVTFKLNNNCAE